MSKLKGFGEFIVEESSTNKLNDHQKDFLNRYVEGNWNVFSDGTVRVKGNVSLAEADITEIPVQFEEVTGYFDCSHSNLRSLKGSPRRVKDYFSCSDCKNLKSLEGGPEVVDESYWSHSNPLLINLKGAPKQVGDSFDCSNCKNLVSLEGCPPRLGGYFDCKNNEKLKSLVGGPVKVPSDYDCNGCKSLVSLEGAPDSLDGAFMSKNCTGLKSLKGIPTLAEEYYMEGCTGLPLVQQKLLESSDAIIAWLDSKMSIEEYTEKFRGKIAGRKFGI